MYSIGKKGYHIYSKQSGHRMGVLLPNNCANIYYIQHPNSEPASQIAQPTAHGPSPSVFPPLRASAERLKPLTLQRGAHPNRPNDIDLADDEWGAGMMQGNFAVGVSRGGRTFICSDWRGALSSPERAAATSAVIECEADGGPGFDLGGWLSVKNNHVLFEVNDRIYILTLNMDGLLPRPGHKNTPLWATTTSSAPQLDVPVSFMAVYDDCLMSTYTVSSLTNTLPCSAHDYSHPADPQLALRPSSGFGRTQTSSPHICYEMHPRHQLCSRHGLSGQALGEAYGRRHYSISLWRVEQGRPEIM